MKTYDKDHLPEEIERHGKIYKVDIEMSHLYNSGRDWESALEKQNKLAVLVSSMSKNLRGKLDLHNKPYEPTKWLYTVTVVPTYKVIKVMRKTARKKILGKGMSLETAQRWVQGVPDSNTSMVFFTKEKLK